MKNSYLIALSLLISLFSQGQTQSLDYTSENAGPSVNTTINDLTTCQLSAELFVYSSGYNGSNWSNTTSNVYINGNLAFSNVAQGTTLTPAQLASYIPITSVQIVNNWSNWGYVKGKLTITSDATTVPVTPTLTSNVEHVCTNGTITIPAALAGTGTALKYYWGTELQNHSSTAPTINTASTGVFYYWVSQVDAGGCESARVRYAAIVGNPTNCDWLEYLEDNAGFSSNVNITPSLCASNVFLYIYASQFDGNSWFGSSVNMTINGNSIGTFPTDTVLNLSSYMPITSIQLTNTAGTWSYTQGHLHVSQDGTAMPTAPTVADLSYCLNETATALTAGAGANNTLRWYDGSVGNHLNTTAPTPSTATADTLTYYVAQITAAGCESSRSAIEVIIHDLPTVNAGSDVTVCAGNTVTLSGSGAQTYTWDNGVQNGVAFTPSASQTYTVTGTDMYGCQNTDALDVTVESCAGINELTDLTVNVYPNPATGVVYVTVENTNVATYVIYLTDVNGKIVYTTAAAQGTQKIDVTPFASGVYYLKLVANTQVTTTKVLIK